MHSACSSKSSWRDPSSKVTIEELSEKAQLIALLGNSLGNSGNVYDRYSGESEG